MKKVLYILFVFGIGVNSSFSQTEFKSDKHNLIYQIQVEDYQIVELIELNDGSFNGTLTHSIWKTNRMGIRKKQISQRITIPNSTVGKLVSELKEIGIENLKDCSEIQDCIIGLDGTTVSFLTSSSENINTASFWELESDYYYNQNKVELPAEVIKARKLISIVNKEFDLKEQFQNFLNRLPKGRYAYSMLIMRKK